MITACSIIISFDCTRIFFEATNHQSCWGTLRGVRCNWLSGGEACEGNIDCFIGDDNSSRLLRACRNFPLALGSEATDKASANARPGTSRRPGVAAAQRLHTVKVHQFKHGGGLQLVPAAIRTVLTLTTPLSVLTVVCSIVLSSHCRSPEITSEAISAAQSIMNSQLVLS